jgi:hypothetical protein
MNLTKGKISKLYSKKKQTLKRNKNKRGHSGRSKTFRKNRRINLARKSLKRVHFKANIGGESTDNTESSKEVLEPIINTPSGEYTPPRFITNSDLANANITSGMFGTKMGGALPDNMDLSNETTQPTTTQLSADSKPFVPSIQNENLTSSISSTEAPSPNSYEQLQTSQNANSGDGAQNGFVAVKDVAESLANS